MRHFIVKDPAGNEHGLPHYTDDVKWMVNEMGFDGVWLAWAMVIYGHYGYGKGVIVDDGYDGWWLSSQL